MQVYNNYFDGNELYGVASTMNAGVVEGSHFAGVPYPCFSTGGYADSGPGRLVQRGNIFAGSGPCQAGRRGAVAGAGRGGRRKALAQFSPRPAAE